MTGTALAAVPTQLPAFLQRQDLVQAAQQFNTSAIGGIKAGGFPRLSKAGSRFYIIDNSAENPRQMITNLDSATQQWVPATYVDVVVVGANPNLSKTYYEGQFVPGEDREPDCSSDDGIRPDPHITDPINPSCTTCPMNVWGSKKTPEGKDTKACSDSKRLVIIPAADLRGLKAMALQVTPAELKEWGVFVRSLNRSGHEIPVFGTICRISFDINVTFPKLIFSFLRLVSAEEFAIIEERMASEEVKNIEKPSRSGGATAPAAPSQKQATPAALPTPPTQPDPAPVTTAGVSFTVHPEQSAPPPAAPAQEDPATGLTPEQVAAIQTVGGPNSPIGQQILAAARAASSVPPAPVQQAPAATPVKRRGRPAKTAETPAAQPTAPETPAQTAAPASAQTSFASSPAAVVVPAGSTQGSQLDELLAGVMGGAAR